MFGGSIMAAEKSTFSGNTSMLVLKLLDEKDMYGYQIIEELALRSENAFQLKTGTIYPLLHSLEKDKMISSYDEKADSLRIRKYYKLTKKGSGFLQKALAEWQEYSRAVTLVMEGGLDNAFA